MLHEMDASKAEPPVAENEAPAKVEEAEPLTPSEEFAAKLDQLAKSTRAAGLNPVREMIKLYARRGFAVLDGILSALDDSPKKKS